MNLPIKSQKQSLLYSTQLPAPLDIVLHLVIQLLGISADSLTENIPYFEHRRDHTLLGIDFDSKSAMRSCITTRT